MDMDRIERALREGPPDEPAYVPGRHRRGLARWTWRLIAVPAIVVALAIGLAVGNGLPALRDGMVGGAADPVAISEALRGSSWASEEMTFKAWMDALLERGFTADEIAAFLVHDPFERSVQYLMAFDESQLTIQASYDEAPPVTLSVGRWAIRDDGSLAFTEIVDDMAPGSGCSIETPVAVGRVELTFDIGDFSRCEVDARLANTAFFDLAPYSKVTP